VSRSIQWPRRRFGSDGGFLDALDFGPDLGGDHVAGIVGALVLAVVLAILVVVLLPLVVLVVEALVVLLASLALRRAWIVRAETLGPPPEIRVWRVRGPLRARSAVREVAGELRRGVPAEPEHAEVPL
jgi:hypothetical protein